MRKFCKNFWAINIVCWLIAIVAITVGSGLWHVNEPQGGWIYEYQSLIGGVLALVAGGFAIFAARLQIEVQKDNMSLQASNADALLLQQKESMRQEALHFHTQLLHQKEVAAEEMQRHLEDLETELYKQRRIEKNNWILSAIKIERWLYQLNQYFTRIKGPIIQYLDNNSYPSTSIFMFRDFEFTYPHIDTKPLEDDVSDKSFNERDFSNIVYLIDKYHTAKRLVLQASVHSDQKNQYRYDLDMEVLNIIGEIFEKLKELGLNKEGLGASWQEVKKELEIRNPKNNKR